MEITCMHTRRWANKRSSLRPFCFCSTAFCFPAATMHHRFHFSNDLLSPKRSTTTNTQPGQSLHIHTPFEDLGLFGFHLSPRFALFFVCFWIHTMYNRYPGGSFHANLASQQDGIIGGNCRKENLTREMASQAFRGTVTSSSENEIVKIR